MNAVMKLWQKSGGRPRKRVANQLKIATKKTPMLQKLNQMMCGSPRSSRKNTVSLERSRPSSLVSRAGCSYTSSSSAADREHRVEVVLREDLERHHRVRLDDAREAGELARDQVRELLLLVHANHCDEIPLAGDRPRLAHALHLREAAAEHLERVPLCAEQHHGVGH